MVVIANRAVPARQSTSAKYSGTFWFEIVSNKVAQEGAARIDARPCRLSRLLVVAVVWEGSF